MIGLRAIGWVCAVLLVAGCGGPGEMFSIDDPIEVEISIDPASWDTLRYSPPGLDHYANEPCPGGPRPRPFEWFPASARVNGVGFSGIEIRKKGFRGSMDPAKPALKLRFPGDDHPGDSRHMTLNSTNQDTSYAKQCLAYHMFHKAGLAAPRCGLARVSVNGDALGVYTNVEPIKGSFLRDQFGDDSGDLYEITFADFEPDLLVMFETKSEEATTDRTRLAGIAEALEAADDALFGQLGSILDLDAYFTFWALEVICGLWDGYHGNRNNTYLYENPTTGLFQFIPWGPDNAFEEPEDFWAPFVGEPGSLPWTVFAHGAIGKRLLSHPEGRQRYADRVRSLFSEVWDPDELVGMMNTMVVAASPYLSERQRNMAWGTARGMKEIIQTQEERLLTGLDAGLAPWERKTLPVLCGEVGHVFSGSVQTEFGTTMDDLENTGEGSVTEETQGEVTDMAIVRATACRELRTTDAKVIAIRTAFGPASNNMAAFLEIEVPEELFVPGGTVSLDVGEAVADVAWMNLGTYELRAAGFVVQGELAFDDVATTPGAPIGFSFTAPVFVVGQ